MGEIRACLSGIRKRCRSRREARPWLKVALFYFSALPQQPLPKSVVAESRLIYRLYVGFFVGFIVHSIFYIIVLGNQSSSFYLSLDGF